MLSFLIALIALGLLILVNVLIALSELSFAAAHESRMRLKAEKGDKRARDFLDLRRNTGQVITAIQICLDGIGILGGIVSSNMLSPAMIAFFQKFDLTKPWAEDISSTLSFFFITGSFVLFADLIPKRVALNSPDAIALRIGWCPRLALKLLRPLVLLFTYLSDSFLRMLKIPTSSSTNLVTIEDIRSTLDAGSSSGALLREEHKMIGNVLNLQKCALSSIMTPREDVTFLDLDKNNEALIKEIINAPHDYYPLCSGSPENIEAILHTQDLLCAYLQDNESFQNNLSKLAFEKSKKAFHFKADMSVWEALARFDHDHEGVAIVTDKDNHTCGLVTYKDILAVMTNGLNALLKKEAIKPHGKGSWTVDPNISPEDFSQFFNEPLDNTEKCQTINEWLNFKLKHMAEVGDKMQVGSLIIEVTEVDTIKIKHIVVRKISPTT